MKVICLSLLILVPAFFVGTVRISAQPPAPVPKPPYLAPVPNFGHWTVVLESEPATSSARRHRGKPKAAPKQIPTTIDTIRTGDLKRVTVSYSTGASEQFDQAGIYFFMTSDSRAQVFIPPPGALPYPFYTTGFLFFDTLKPSWFKNVDKIEGVDCFHYQNGSTQLWVAVDSMLPVAAKSDGITAHYQFQPAPDSPLVLPPDEKAALENEMNAHKASQSVR